MVVFKEMTTEEYVSWREHSIKEYAEDLVRAGNATQESALRLATADFDRPLSQGLKTEGQYLLTIVDEQTSQRVGVVWYHDYPQKADAIFIGDIEIDDQFRGRGYGTATLGLLEVKARELGKKRISLHVFAHNPRAKKLYETLGYKPTNITMAKDI
jgi:RimJ/RimL family protein N-acetyltransferase